MGRGTPRLKTCDCTGTLCYSILWLTGPKRDPTRVPAPCIRPRSYEPAVTEQHRHYTRRDADADSRAHHRHERPPHQTGSEGGPRRSTRQLGFGAQRSDSGVRPPRRGARGPDNKRAGVTSDRPNGRRRDPSRGPRFDPRILPPPSAKRDAGWRAGAQQMRR
jgi:hypothetical protein